MNQAKARKRAKELGGIAVSAHLTKAGNWRIGGWPSAHDQWIVISIDKTEILDTGEAREGDS